MRRIPLDNADIDNLFIINPYSVIAGVKYAFYAIVNIGLACWQNKPSKRISALFFAPAFRWFDMQGNADAYRTINRCFPGHCACGHKLDDVLVSGCPGRCICANESAYAGKSWACFTHDLTRNGKRNVHCAHSLHNQPLRLFLRPLTGRDEPHALHQNVGETTPCIDGFCVTRR